MGISINKLNNIMIEVLIGRSNPPAKQRNKSVKSIFLLNYSRFVSITVIYLLGRVCGETVKSMTNVTANTNLTNYARNEFFEKKNMHIPFSIGRV